MCIKGMMKTWMSVCSGMCEREIVGEEGGTVRCVCGLRCTRCDGRREGAGLVERDDGNMCATSTLLGRTGGG